MRLRQVVLVAEKLEPLSSQLQQLFGLGEGFHDPGVGHFGLVNVVFPVGDTFLEIVAPEREGTAGGRYLERRGAGGYMVIVQVDDIESTRRHAAELGVRQVWQADHDDIRASHFHPRDVGGAILSVDQPVPPEAWRWAGPGWQQRSRNEITTGVVGAELQSGDPRALAARWGEVLGLPVQDRGDEWHLELEGGRLRFRAPRDDRDDGVSAFDLEVADADTVRRRAADLGLADEQGEIAPGAITPVSITPVSITLGGIVFRFHE